MKPGQVFSVGASVGGTHMCTDRLWPLWPCSGLPCVLMLTVGDAGRAGGHILSRLTELQGKALTHPVL